MKIYGLIPKLLGSILNCSVQHNNYLPNISCHCHYQMPTPHNGFFFSNFNLQNFCNISYVLMKYTIYTTGKKLWNIWKAQWKHSHLIFWFVGNGLTPTTNKYSKYPITFFRLCRFLSFIKIMTSSFTIDKCMCLVWVILKINCYFWLN